MKKTLRKIVFGATLIGALYFSSCYNKQEIPSYSHNGVFNGFPVEVGVKDNQRYIRISETWGNRGYKPAQIIARDTDPNKFGFEYRDIQFFSAYDLATGTDPSKISVLKKFGDPIELERIFAYVNVDKKLDKIR